MLRKIENFDILRKISLPFLKKSNISHSDVLQIYPTYGLQLGRTRWKIGKIEELLGILK